MKVDVHGDWLAHMQPQQQLHLHSDFQPYPSITKACTSSKRGMERQPATNCGALIKVRKRVQALKLVTVWSGVWPSRRPSLLMSFGDRNCILYRMFC